MGPLGAFPHHLHLEYMLSLGLRSGSSHRSTPALILNRARLGVAVQEHDRSPGTVYEGDPGLVFGFDPPLPVST